ncbi:MAG: Rieske 2Fe-2S domain-containing protein [Arenicellales bacterium WSBS_2016_MAG_OTU3]
MSWKPVCGVNDVKPGSLKEFEVDGIEILVSNLEGEMRVYPPMCPHMEEPLAASGLCKGEVMTCTKHLWQWNLRTGEPVAPGENDRCMLIYESKVDGDRLMANIEAELEYDFDDD